MLRYWDCVSPQAAFRKFNSWLAFLRLKSKLMLKSSSPLASMRRSLSICKFSQGIIITGSWGQRTVCQRPSSSFHMAAASFSGFISSRLGAGSACAWESSSITSLNSFLESGQGEIGSSSAPVQQQSPRSRTHAAFTAFSSCFLKPAKFSLCFFTASVCNFSRCVSLNCITSCITLSCCCCCW